MKLRSLLLGALLAAAATLPVGAQKIPAWKMDNQFTMGFALGAGMVEKSNAEILAMQYRLELRVKRLYIAYRQSRVAQVCNSRPNPTESSFLAGVSLPFDSGRNRVNFGVGLGTTSLRGAAWGIPCEMRVKFGVLGLTVFSNFNREHSFHGFCLSLDFPLRIFRK